MIKTKKMKINTFCAKAILSFSIMTLLFSVSSFSQQAEPVKENENNGLRTVEFTTPEGKVTVILPSDVGSNDIVSGTILTNPKGTNEKKKTKNRNVLNGYVVDIEEKKKPKEKPEKNEARKKNTVKNQSGNWKIPDIPGNDSFVLSLKNQTGEILADATLPLSVHQVESAAPVVFDRLDFRVPGYLRAGEPERITGVFDGDFSTSDLKLNDSEAQILAESPREIFFKPPEDISGPATLELTEGEFTLKEQTHVISLDLSAEKLALQRGEQTTVRVVVSGLENFQEVVPLEVSNLTPQNIQIQGGNVQHFLITPAEVNEAGTFEVDLNVTAVSTGGFSVSSSVLPHSSVSEKNDLQKVPEAAHSIPVSGGLGETLFLDFTPPVKTATLVELPDGNSYVASYQIDAQAEFTLEVDIPDSLKQSLRNRARNIPADTPLGPRSPDARSRPYSRPVPPGIRSAPYHENSGVWRNGQRLLSRARQQVEKAKKHKGDIGTGVPGYRTMGHLMPGEVVRHENRKCTEKIYTVSQVYYYVNDRTLILEEQLSPSFEFFVAHGQNTIDIKKTETGWSVSPGVSVGIKGVSVGISGSYWKKTEHITGTGTSELTGRNLWLFHIGRLFLLRKAYLRITYKYHYETCDDGSTRNWVETTATDNWYYGYEWEEELFAASKDDEGNFHRVDGFPATMHRQQMNEERYSYEADGLEPEDFENFGDFFPSIKQSASK